MFSKSEHPSIAAPRARQSWLEPHSSTHLCFPKSFCPSRPPGLLLAERVGDQVAGKTSMQSSGKVDFIPAPASPSPITTL